MSTATVSNPAEISLIDKPKRGRKAQEKGESVTTRFFMGEATTDSVSLKQEFGTEVEAQLESLKLNKPYYTIDSWKAVADLSNGSIAVQKRPISTKT
jgi:hypothetical protein